MSGRLPAKVSGRLVLYLLLLSFLLAAFLPVNGLSADVAGIVSQHQLTNSLQSERSALSGRDERGRSEPEFAAFVSRYPEQRGFRA